MRSVIGAFLLCSICRLGAEDALSNYQIEVPLGKMIESKSVEVILPIPKTWKGLVVESSKGSCKCIVSTGISNGQTLDPEVGEPIKASLDLSGYRGSLSVKIAAKCQSKDGGVKYAIWGIDGEISPKTDLRKFYDLGSVAFGKSRMVDIPFTRFTSEKVDLEQPSKNLDGKILLNWISKGDRKSALSINLPSDEPGTKIGYVTTKIGGIENKIVFTWEVELQKGGVQKIVAKPTPAGQWTPFLIPLSESETTQISDVVVRSGSQIQIRVRKDGSDGRNIFEFFGSRAGACKENLEVIFDNSKHFKPILVPIEVYFLPQQQTAL